MRTIKFRGKSKRDGKWYIGNLYDKDIYGKTHICTINRGCLDIDPDTVGQFTGLRDNNGLEIYEGDIICSEKYKHIHVISYDDSLGSFVGKTPGDRYGTFTGLMSQKWINDFDKEIIGNIHDNPELLKQQEL